MSSAIEQDMDTFSSQEALEFERAYYKVYEIPEFTKLKG